MDSGLGVMVQLVLKGKLNSIDGVDGFWRLFRRIVARKVMAKKCREAAIKRGGSAHRLVPDDFDLFESGLPSVEVCAIADDVTERLLELLDPPLEAVARMRTAWSQDSRPAGRTP